MDIDQEIRRLRSLERSREGLIEDNNIDHMNIHQLSDFLTHLPDDSRRLEVLKKVKRDTLGDFPWMITARFTRYDQRWECIFYLLEIGCFKVDEEGSFGDHLNRMLWLMMGFENEKTKVKAIGKYLKLRPTTWLTAEDSSSLIQHLDVRDLPV